MIISTLAISFSRLALQLGGPGLVLVGILDSSLIPTAGLQDFLTVILAAADRDWWFYYAAMSTTGAMLGGYMTYRLGRKGGEEALEKRLPRDKVDLLKSKFETLGWGAIFLSAVLPPPFPAPPLLLAAGAMSYPIRRYLGLLAMGRAVRYFGLALLASLFGRRIIGFLRDSNLVWAMIAGGTVLVAVTVIVVLLVKRRNRLAVTREGNG